MLTAQNDSKQIDVSEGKQAENTTPISLEKVKSTRGRKPTVHDPASK